MTRNQAAALALTVIVVIGSFLRLWDLDDAQYRGDDVTVSGLALDIVREGRIPTGVLSSVGIANGPVAPIILAPATFISVDHELNSVYLALLNIAMIPIGYVLARDLFGPRAGLIAAALIAVNPWLVIYGRRLWLNAFIGPTAMFFLWALYRAARSNKLLAWALAGAAVAASAQIHLSSLPNLLGFGGALAFRDRFPYKRLAVGAAAALLILVPWMVLSLQPDLSKFDLAGAKTVVPEITLGSLERATIVATGVAYQSIAGQAGQIVDATSGVFFFVDGLARAFAVAGWLWLIWLLWRERSTSPAKATVYIACIIMVAAPTLLLLRPVQAGQLPYLYPYYFINLIPPLILGIAAVADRLSRTVPNLGLLLLAPILAAQLLLAVPFFMTNGEFWPLGGYGVPWKFTNELVTTAQRNAETGLGAIFVGGNEDDDSEQASVAARLLKRDNGLVRLFDGRDGLMFRAGDLPVTEVTTNEQHVMTQFLRGSFGSTQVFEQVLPGSGWTRRVFQVPPSQIERWAVEHFPLLPTSPGTTVVYDRVGLLPAGREFDTPRLGILWHFDADPSEPFLTDTVIFEGDREVFRDVHVAYPASWWQKGDWAQTRMLNLFALPADLKLSAQATVQFTHRGVISGKAIAPPVRVAPVTN